MYTLSEIDWMFLHQLYIDDAFRELTKINLSYVAYTDAQENVVKIIPNNT